MFRFFLKLTFLTILRYVEAVDTIGDLTRSIQGRAAEPKEELDAPWRSQKMDRLSQFLGHPKVSSHKRSIFIPKSVDFREFQVLKDTKDI